MQEPADVEGFRLSAVSAECGGESLFVRRCRGGRIVVPRAIHAEEFHQFLGQLLVDGGCSLTLRNMWVDAHGIPFWLRGPSNLM